MYYIIGCILLIPSILLVIGLLSITDEDRKKLNSKKTILRKKRYTGLPWMPYV
jgi:hypothetical protein